MVYIEKHGNKERKKEENIKSNATEQIFETYNGNMKK
jgi:hypothetical protein